PLLCPDTFPRSLRDALPIFDHAPTAMLAARGLGIRSALLGPGFASPPRTSPMPSIRPWLETPEAQLAEREKRVVSTINGVARALDPKSTRLNSIHDWMSYAV